MVHVNKKMVQLWLCVIHDSLGVVDPRAQSQVKSVVKRQESIYRSYITGSWRGDWRAGDGGWRRTDCRCFWGRHSPVAGTADGSGWVARRDHGWGRYSAITGHANTYGRADMWLSAGLNAWRQGGAATSGLGLASWSKRRSGDAVWHHSNLSRDCSDCQGTSEMLSYAFRLREEFFWLTRVASCVKWRHRTSSIHCIVSRLAEQVGVSGASLWNIFRGYG